MINHYLKNISLIFLSLLIVIPGCSTPNTIPNALNRSNLSIPDSKGFKTKGLYNEFANETIVPLPVLLKTKVDYFITYWLPEGGSGGCKYDTKETTSISDRNGMSFQYYNNQWYVNHGINSHIIPENGGSFSGEDYSGSLSVSSDTITIEVNKKNTLPDVWNTSNARLWDNHSDVCSRPSDVVYYYDSSLTSVTYDYSFSKSFHFSPNPDPTPTLTPSNYSSSSPSSDPSSNPSPTPNSCDGKSINPNQTQNLSNNTKSLLPPLDESMNNALDLAGFDKRIQKMTEQLKKLNQKLNDKGFTVQAFDPQPLRNQIAQLQSDKSNLESEKKNKVNLINNSLSTLQSNNQNIISEANSLTTQSDNLEQYNFTDFNNFKSTAEDLKYEFDDYVSSENTYGLIESAKIISKETALYNKLVSVYSSGLLPEVIDNNDELPQYQDDETYYDKIQKPRQLIHWLNNRIKSQTNRLENKRLALNEKVQEYILEAKEFLRLSNESNNTFSVKNGGPTEGSIDELADQLKGANALSRSRIEMNNGIISNGNFKSTNLKNELNSLKEIRNSGGYKDLPQSEKSSIGQRIADLNNQIKETNNIVNNAEKGNKTIIKNLEKGNNIVDNITNSSQKPTQKQLEKGIKSVEKLVDEHIQKRDDYIKNPDKYDNDGRLKNARTPEEREKIIQGRVKALNDQITKQKKLIEFKKDLIKKGDSCP